MKLQGIRVVDLSLFLPGPLLTLAMADHGAEVIKVEPPGGDPGRALGLSDGPHTVFFRNLNRGKKSVVVNLKEVAQREALLRLCEIADVFVESFRPGVATRLGVDYATVSGRNPRIVYCSISAFGQDGPYRDRPAHDLVVEALSGALSVTQGRDGTPAIPGLAAADYLSGLQGLAGVLMALLRREQTGQGDWVEISMHDSVVGATLNLLGPTLAENRQPVTKHERSTGGAAFYQIYDTQDGRQIVLAGQERPFVETLLHDLGRPDLVAPCLRGPGPHQRPVIEFLAGVFHQKTLAECIAWLSTLDVCWGQVNTFPEALADPGLNVRGMILRDERGRRHLGSPIHFRHEPARPDLRPPGLGEHTQQILEPAPAAPSS
jgi:crotonobetainyl-CoA:carnitine CoA-transferase CaiB-like acyl-CoA transferase